MLLRLNTAFPFCVIFLLWPWNNTCCILSSLEDAWNFSNLTKFFCYICIDPQMRCSMKGVNYWEIPIGISCCTTVNTEVVFYVHVFIESCFWAYAAYSLSINNDQFILLHNRERGAPSWLFHWGLLHFYIFRKESIFGNQKMYVPRERQSKSVSQFLQQLKICYCTLIVA